MIELVKIDQRRRRGELIDQVQTISINNSYTVIIHGSYHPIIGKGCGIRINTNIASINNRINISPGIYIYSIANRQIAEKYFRPVVSESWIKASCSKCHLLQTSSIVC